jgi:uncharacterized protein (DUF608 family)
MVGGWLLSHVYEHYRFTSDVQFLKRYYNIIYEAVQFCQVFLVESNGWKVTNLSVSPENSYKNGSTSGSITIGSTIDSSILWKLFGNLLEAAEVLGKPVARDHTLQAAQSVRASDHRFAFHPPQKLRALIYRYKRIKRSLTAK